LKFTYRFFYARFLIYVYRSSRRAVHVYFCVRLYTIIIVFAQKKNELQVWERGKQVKGLELKRNSALPKMFLYFWTLICNMPVEERWQHVTRNCFRMRKIKIMSVPNERSRVKRFVFSVWNLITWLMSFNHYHGYVFGTFLCAVVSDKSVIIWYKILQIIPMTYQYVKYTLNHLSR
jgi:hypothetical protein